MRRIALIFAVLLSGCAQRGCGREPAPSLDRWTREPSTVARTVEPLVFHPVLLDGHDAILPWSRVDAPFHQVVSLGWRAFVDMPDAPNGKPPYFSASMFEGPSFAPAGWLQNPPGLAAMLVRSTVRWRAYSGDGAPLAKTRLFVDHVLTHGMTEESDAWSRVPYASANGGELEYRGGEDTTYCEKKDPCGRGDGRGFLEPDKIGELGHALVLLYEATGEQRYLETAIHFADELGKHVTPGDAKHSPWPFRVDAKTASVVREPYTSNVVFTVSLFDELERLGKATEAHKKAREIAWNWLLAFPIKTNHWQAFFEDIPIHLEPGTNPNQYSAGETARYLLTHPERDPAWRAHVDGILGWIVRTFAVDVDSPIGKTPGRFHGAEVISEQKADMAKMGSHTARFASILALLHEKTLDPQLRARAFRSLSWATYCIDDKGVVKVGPDDREGYWFSDGYGDYLPHFVDAMAAVPAWAPSGEGHLLRSSSVVTEITYGPKELRYSAFDPSGTEELRLPTKPVKITGGDAKITAMPTGVHVVITRTGKTVTIEL
ncbi:MAG: hypothetical protein ACXWUG_11490 [Polyangiales bacterium]